jgi:hypothetical protein
VTTPPVDTLLAAVTQRLRERDATAAIALIAAAPAAVRNVQPVQRLLAAAQAEQGDLESAQQAITRALAMGAP